MSMEAFIANPEAIEVTVTMRMPLRHWQQLRDQLESKWPSSDLHRDLSALIRQVEGKCTLTPR